jgi:uncharacterized protein YndB with AHSA1/START domain
MGDGMKLVERTIHINAPADLLYELLTDGEHLARWIADSAETDPRPGGVVRWTHANGDSCSGHFVELVPSRRIVFTYGWDRAEVGVPPGSTTVEITLRPSAAGTELRLVHRGLLGPMADAHDGGWAHYLARLTKLAEGHDPHPDPFATRRVPTAAELGLR